MGADWSTTTSSTGCVGADLNATAMYVEGRLEHVGLGFSILTSLSIGNGEPERIKMPLILLTYP